uniref:Uncharacterized protein n=1 Tax=Gopherus evgoodei TaxID=1825980 RepID=A0A8C4WDH0_9SAUR
IPGRRQKPWRRSWDTPTLDPHVQLLGERVVRSLRLKPERWERCVGSPEVQHLLWGFLEGAAGQPPLLLVTLSLTGQLALSTEYTASPGRGKVLFFLRRGSGPLSAPPGPRELLYGDLPASSLEHFATLVEEVRRRLDGNPGAAPSPLRFWVLEAGRDLPPRLPPFWPPRYS